MTSFREATPSDAATIAELHARSWQRHYRGAYSDEFLDGDVATDRLAVWTAHLSRPGGARLTLLAEDPAPVGFVSACFGADPRFGTLIDNLHVTHRRQRSGIGRRLLNLVAEEHLARGEPGGIYLWVLEQNTRAQAFYEAVGGERRELAPVDAPGGVPARLNGAPRKLRYAWPDAAAALTKR